jgi:hypothetical protein
MWADELAANASPASRIGTDIQPSTKVDSGFSIDVPKISYDCMKKTAAYLSCCFDYDRRPRRIAANAWEIILPDQRSKVLQDAPQPAGSTLNKVIITIERNEISFHNLQIFN